jgi:dTDP-L-rhamnose 4-epimerase
VGQGREQSALTVADVRILVTGASGFIGSHVMEALAADGHTVTGLDLRVPSPQAGPPGSAAHDSGFIRADVRDTDAVAAALHGVDVVCHQAAMVGLGSSFADTPEYVSRNDLGTAVLLAQMADAGVRRLVLASSMVIYGEGTYECPVHGAVRAGPRAAEDLAVGQFEPCCPDCAEPLRPGLVGEDTPPDPRNVYAVTKLAQEGLAAAWARTTGGIAAAMRYHNVYGPRMPRDTPYAGVAAIFRSALARGDAPRVFEDGGQLRDFVHVRDVARANAAAVRWSRGDAGRAGKFRAFNVGSGTPRSVGELAAALSEVLEGPPPKVTGEYRLGDVRHIVASSERLRSELGWGPSVSFAEGIAEFANLRQPEPAA